MSEINLLNANNFKSTKESRAKLLDLLSFNERKMFKLFVQSVEKGNKGF